LPPGGQLGEAALSPLVLDALPRNTHVHALDYWCFGLTSHAFASRAAACCLAADG
jgi:hypothetical protein